MKIKVFLVCSGLGQINRGFESFSQECFEVLSQEPYLDLTLFKGGGISSEKAITLPNLSRKTQLALQLAKIFSKSSYFIEQASFTLSLIPYIYQKKPDIIYFSDGTIGNILWHWRSLTHQSYRLLFSNGAPFFPPYAPYCDHTQQLTPHHLKKATEQGLPVTEQTLLPYGLQISSDLEMLTVLERQAYRHHLGIPEQQSVILSVGAINKSHKRMDYLIKEVANLPEPRPYLLLLGQQDIESSEVIKLGNELLGSNHFAFDTVTHHQLRNYYKIADLFVLPSLMEGFGRVFLEAMSYGVPCLAHNYEVAHFILGEDGYFGNFELCGSLTTLIKQVLQLENYRFEHYQKRHYSVYERFGWHKLGLRYLKMFEDVFKFSNNLR